MKKCDHYPLSAHLEQDGWLTPDTYSTNYARFPDTSGVYIFLYSDLDLAKIRLEAERVLYVGMSLSIAQRQIGHEVYGSICDDIYALKGGYFHCSRWFKQVAEDRLRTEEARLIRYYDPPYNLIHRRKGLAA